MKRSRLSKGMKVGKKTRLAGLSVYKKQIGEFDKYIKYARVTPDLRSAMVELRAALMRGNRDLAYELSAVKSHVAGGRGEEVVDVGLAKKYPFVEASGYNERVLGRNVYVFLDTLHFDLAMSSGKLPAGMMVVEAEGIRQKGVPVGKSPTLVKIRRETERTKKEAGL